MKLLVWLLEKAALGNEKIRPRDLGSTLGALKPLTMPTSGGMLKVPPVKSIRYAQASAPVALNRDVPLCITE